MGLKASFSIEDSGYPMTTPNLQIPIDYSAGIETFRDVFLSTAQDLVPVRTGNLMNSILANCDASSVTCWTDCEYSQYIEYGTIKMNAQPYFYPALEEAMSAAKVSWDETKNDMLAEEQRILEEEREEMEAMAGGGLLAMILASMIVGIIMGCLRVLEDMLNGGDKVASVAYLMSCVDIEVYD